MCSRGSSAPDSRAAGSRSCSDLSNGVHPLIVRSIAVLSLALASAPLAAQDAETITVDAAAPTRPFPHFWERMFGSGRAVLTLRESYREDLRAVRSVTALGYVRFHGILDDDIGVYSEGRRGEPRYNFSYVDQVYDGLLANGVRPFVELSFMPSRLAQRAIRHSFWYHPVVSPPKDYRRWDGLITALARHLVQRYGIEEVSHWYFEVLAAVRSHRQEPQSGGHAVACRGTGDGASRVGGSLHPPWPATRYPDRFRFEPRVRR